MMSDYFMGLAIIYILLTAAQFTYQIFRDTEQMRRHREHSEKLIDAQQSVAQDSLQAAWKRGYQAAVVAMHPPRKEDKSVT